MFSARIYDLAGPAAAAGAQGGGEVSARAHVVAVLWLPRPQGVVATTGAIIITIPASRTGIQGVEHLRQQHGEAQ